MPYPETFSGFQSPSAENWMEFEKGSWKPRPFGDYDVDIKCIPLSPSTSVVPPTIDQRANHQASRMLLSLYE